MGSLQSFESEIEKIVILLWELVVHLDHLVYREDKYFSLRLLGHDGKLALPLIMFLELETEIITIISQHASDDIDDPKGSSNWNIDIFDVGVSW